MSKLIIGNIQRVNIKIGNIQIGVQNALRGSENDAAVAFNAEGLATRSSQSFMDHFYRSTAVASLWKYPVADLDISNYHRAMTERQKLLAEIEDFIAKSHVAPSKFGVLAMNDSAFVGRLRSGGDVRTETARRVRDFMRDWRPEKPSSETEARVA